MPKKQSKFAAQPAVADVLRLVSRKGGATMQELQALRKNQPHTIRAILSRLGSKAGIAVELTDSKRGRVYRIARKAVRS